jgi:hypothetical protein
MSERPAARALERLAARNGVLAPERGGSSYAVIPDGDRRRKAIVRVSATTVRELVSDGALEAAGDGAYRLSESGQARVTRGRALPDEAFAAQHGQIVDRPVMDCDGEVRIARGYDADRLLRRLSSMRDGAGRAWLDRDELNAAARLRADWERGEIGMVRGSDWNAPMAGSTARAGGMDGLMAARCDARRRFSDALAKLAGPLRCAVERVVLREEGLEALERAEAWPTRSGKIALKLALAQLAANYCA